MKKRTYTLKRLKLCKMVALLPLIIGVIIALGTVSTSDYEAEANVPIDERMTQAEMIEKFVFAGLFSVIGAAYYLVLGWHEDELDRIDAENEAERYEEW